MIGGLAIGSVAVLGALLLGFCGYEVTWKTRRLRRDLVLLRGLEPELRNLQTQLIHTQRDVLAAAAATTGPGDH